MSNLKKTCYRIIALLTFTSINLIAYQDYYQFNSNDQYCKNCCSDPNCCLSTSRFFVKGDVLYWTPRITGLELNFGSTEITEEIIDCTQVLTTKELDLDPHFKWNAGYRIGFGYEANRWWKAEALWTHFHGRGDRDKNEEAGINNSGKLKIKFDQLDIALSYNYNPECFVTFKPFVGLRTTRIHEHINALLITNISLSNSTAIETKIFDDTQKYWGIGPLLGMQGDWEISCGFGLYGTVAASLLYGNYKVKFDDSDILTAPVSKQIFNDNKRHMHAFDYNIDLAIGVSWHAFFWEHYELDMRLGFEQHQYFNQNRLCIGRGDISFTGAVFSLELGF